MHGKYGCKILEILFSLFKYISTLSQKEISGRLTSSDRRLFGSLRDDTKYERCPNWYLQSSSFCIKSDMRMSTTF